MKLRETLAGAPGDVASDEVVSVTELAWAVSRVLNFVQQSKQRVLVSKHGYVIAAIVPATNDDFRN
jgi:antitoxin (DNA-binding transcriptional repressor) of toxin-antitoxin stability system